MDLRAPEKITNNSSDATLVSSPDLQVIRQERLRIRDLITDGKFDEIGRLPGFRIVRRRETFPPQPVTCIVYLFGISKYGDTEIVHPEGWAEEIARKVIKESPEVPVAQPGDIVIYGTEHDPLKHVGKAIDEKTVESKFGRYSHVFQHPINTVSSAYGDIIKIHRPSEEKQKLFHLSQL